MSSHPSPHHLFTPPRDLPTTCRFHGHPSESRPSSRTRSTALIPPPLLSTSSEHNKNKNTNRMSATAQSKEQPSPGFASHGFTSPGASSACNGSFAPFTCATYLREERERKGRRKGEGRREEKSGKKTGEKKKKKGGGGYG
eukprot:TRINITY_DN1377_c0_g1_i1.p3 TRINITY_DN1377_c0_g1~~TRINITY_DN1377_c0_g1_i1.p3  ORF type:complete len:141 (+),score=9.67 TRINITY_DN1377_c0_g1_i1:382-804(+)